MSKIAVVYWSGTGNTQMMAQKVAQGVQEAGAEAVIFTAAEFSADMMDSFDAVAFGCPSIALFGSYGWGDGEWMRSWEQICEQDGAVFACESVICNETPDSQADADCIALGKALV